MAPITRTPKLWLIRFTAAFLVVLALLTGLAGHQRAFAADLNDDNEVVTSGPNACTPTADLPSYPNATCTKHKTEQDEDGTKIKNEYGTADSVDTVRRAYEAAFGPNGWTLLKSEYDAEDQQWEYTVTKGQRQVEVKVEAQEPDEGTATEITIEEQ